jgi:hypothetical protein
VKYVDIEINVFLCSEKLVGIGEVWREPDHDQGVSGSNLCIAVSSMSASAIAHFSRFAREEPV